MKKISIIMGIFILIIYASHTVKAQTSTWSIDLFGADILPTIYCIPNAPFPTVGIPNGGECLGNTANIQIHYNDNRPYDSGVYQFTQIMPNCSRGNTGTIGPDPTLIQICNLDKYTGLLPVIADSMDRAGNNSGVAIDIGFVRGWYKLNGASFHRLGLIADRLPENPSPYDATDTTQPYVIVGNQGVATATQTIAPVGNGVQVSEPQWRGQSYTLAREFDTINEFMDIIKVLHEYTEITDLSEVQSNGAYYISTNQVINSDVFAGKQNFVVLFQDADLTINVNLNTNGSQSYALLTNQNLNISENVTALGGIYMGNIVDLAYENVNPDTDPSPNELKINGNLVSYIGIPSIKRERNDLSRPTFYIQYNMRMYFDLIDYIALLNQDGWQIQ